MILSWFTNLIILVFGLSFNLPATFTNNLEFINVSNFVPEYKLSADKAAVVSYDGRVLFFSRNSQEIQPIASISKLMTALVFLDTNPNFEDVYKITGDDHVLGGRIHLFVGDSLTIKDLFLTSLVASDNGATLALVHSSGLSEKEFIANMNEKAKELRLLNTSFVDPIGLSEDNVSTAREAALLMLHAYRRSEIREAIALKDYRFSTKEGREKYLESTDYLLFENDSNFPLTPLGGKTGYIDKAGYCFAGIFQDELGNIYAVSVLNSESKNSRFQESKAIINWVLNSYFIFKK